MAATKPYQPLLLRLLHAINGAIVLVCVLTGFWIYDTWDGRFGRLPLPKADRSLIDIHGTFGLTLLFAFLAFAIYSLTRGRNRLVQANTLSTLGQWGKPAGWYALHRLVNTGMLVAGVFALASGKLMDENWLPSGDVGQPLILVHLTAWAVMVCAIVLHLLMIVKVGGVPLIRSMVHLAFPPEESPALWPAQIKAWWHRLRSKQ